MYPRNAASPERLAVGPVVQISDGAVQTSGVSVKVLPQGGAAGAGGGTVAYEEGVVHYLPTQAETNYTSFLVIAYKTGCIPATITVVTSASATAGYAGLDWSKVTAPTTTIALTGTTISTTQVVASVSGAVDPWATTLPGAYGAGTAGKIIGDNINATISSRSTQASVDAIDGIVDSILIDTAEIGAAGAGLTALASAANLATVANYLDTEIAAILADTNELQSDWANGGRLDLILNARASQGSVDDLPTNAELATALGAADDAVLAQVALVKAKTDLIPAAPAAVGDIPTATQNADAVLNRDLSAVADTSARSLLNAVRFLRNKWSISGTTLTVTKEDDATSAWTAQVSTTPGANPVTGNDPA